MLEQGAQQAGVRRWELLDEGGDGLDPLCAVLDFCASGERIYCEYRALGTRLRYVRARTERPVERHQEGVSEDRLQHVAQVLLEQACDTGGRRARGLEVHRVACTRREDPRAPGQQSRCSLHALLKHGTHQPRSGRAGP